MLCGPTLISFFHWLTGLRVSGDLEERLLLCIENSPLKWVEHLIRMSLFGVSHENHTGSRTRDRPRIPLRD